MILLCGFLVLYVVRVVMFPRVVLKRVRGEIMETACLSCVCVAFTTVVQMVVLNLVGDWGREWGEVALVLWWVNVAMALGCVIGIPYVITRMEAPGVDAVPPGILLPAISALTVAAGGGVVCRYGELRAGLEVPVVVVSFLFVGVGMGLSLLVDGVVLARLLEKGAFPTEQVCFQLHPGQDSGNNFFADGISIDDHEWSPGPRELRVTDLGSSRGAWSFRDIQQLPFYRINGRQHSRHLLPISRLADMGIRHFLVGFRLHRHPTSTPSRSTARASTLGQKLDILVTGIPMGCLYIGCDTIGCRLE